MPISDNVNFGANVEVYHPDLVNIYGCEIGDESTIGPFIEIQNDVVIGTRCKISSHSFICQGVTIDDEVFIGHGVKFINDLYPRASNPDGSLQNQTDWTVAKTYVKKRASIGTNSTILGNVSIGENALVGAGAVVTVDVPDFAIVVGVPAKIIGYTDDR